MIENILFAGYVFGVIFFCHAIAQDTRFKNKRIFPAYVLISVWPMLAVAAIVQMIWQRWTASKVKEPQK